MAYNVELAERIRRQLAIVPNVAEKAMMGGYVFMVNDKMCVGIIKDEMMIRVDPELHNSSVEKTGCRAMDFTGKTMKGYLLIDESGMNSSKDFNYWLNLALEFNPRAVASKKKNKSPK